MAVQSNDLWLPFHLIFFPKLILSLMSRNKSSWYKFEFEIFNRSLIDVLSWKIFSSKHEISLLFWINWTKTFWVYKDFLLLRTLMDKSWISIVYSSIWCKSKISNWLYCNIIIRISLQILLPLMSRNLLKLNQNLE